MSEIVKRDKEFWIQKVKEFKESGLTIRAFCRNNNIPDSTFHYKLYPEKEEEQRNRVKEKNKAKIRKPRIHVSDELKKSYVKEFASFNGTKAAFARKIGMHHNSFSKWFNKFSEEVNQSKFQELAQVKKEETVEIKEITKESIVIEVNDIKIHVKDGFSEDLLKKLMKAIKND